MIVLEQESATASAAVLEPWAQAVYDPVQADQAVRLKRLLKDQRFWNTLSTLSNLVSAVALDRLIQSRNKSQADQKRARARHIKEALLDLGATFIKLGQFLSVRKDIISEELAEELVSLQDRVPPFDYEILRGIIQRELGELPEVLFTDFETTPIASASIRASASSYPTHARCHEISNSAILMADSSDSTKPR